MSEFSDKGTRLYFVDMLFWRLKPKGDLRSVTTKNATYKTEHHNTRYKKQKLLPKINLITSFFPINFDPVIN